MSTWDFIEIPALVRNRVFEFLDAVAGTLASQSCWACLGAPLPEAELWPVPRFMSANGLAPSARRGTLTVRHLGQSLHRFAARSAGLRSMFQQVFVQVGLGLAQEEYLHPWMQENAHHRVQRTAALAVLSLTISLPDAGSASRLGPLLQTLRARANRPSTSLTVSAGFGRIEGHGSSLEDGVRALPMSEALLRWGHLASRPVHLRPPVNPLSGTSEAGNLSRARLRSLAATSKAKAIATASAAPSGSPAACPALAKSSAPVPRPPDGPPPDALLASRNMGSDSRRVRPRPSRQAEPEDAEDF